MGIAEAGPNTPRPLEVGSEDRIRRAYAGAKARPALDALSLPYLASLSFVPGHEDYGGYRAVWVAHSAAGAFLLIDIHLLTSKEQ
jgi:hypothetical protein